MGRGGRLVLREPRPHVHLGAGSGAGPDSWRRKQRAEAHEAAPGPAISEG